MVVYHPQLIQQLIFYQSDITDMYTRYTVQSVLLYDTQFRRKIANKTIARWDFHDIACRSSHLIPLQKPMSLSSNRNDQGNNSKNVCFACKQPGHHQNSPACPLHIQANLPYVDHQVITALPAAGTQTNIQNQPFLAPQQRNQFSQSNNANTMPKRSAQIPNQAQQPRKRGHCSFWNNGNCVKRDCTFVHACDICGELPHTRQYCPRR